MRLAIAAGTVKEGARLVWGGSCEVKLGDRSEGTKIMKRLHDEGGEGGGGSRNREW